jgi:hypothetical protein
MLETFDLNSAVLRFPTLGFPRCSSVHEGNSQCMRAYILSCHAQIICYGIGRLSSKPNYFGRAWVCNFLRYILEQALFAPCMLKESVVRGQVGRPEKKSAFMMRLCAFAHSVFVTVFNDHHLDKIHDAERLTSFRMNWHLKA